MPLPIPYLLEHLGLEWPLGHHCGGGSLEKTLHQPDPPLSSGPLERPALAQGSKNTDLLSQLLGTASISPGAQEKDIFKRNGFQAHRQVEQVPPRPFLTQRCSTPVWRPGTGLVDTELGAGIRVTIPGPVWFQPGSGEPQEMLAEPEPGLSIVLPFSPV